MDKFSEEILIISGVTSIFIITVFLLIVSAGIIMLVLLYQKKQLQYLKEKQQLQNNFQQELLRAQLEIQEQTFKNISQEIHDNIGQVLALAKLNVNTMAGCNVETLTAKIDDIRSLISKAIQDLRDLSKSLNTDFVSEMGLIKSIEYELEMIKKAGNYQIYLHQEGESFNLPHQKELILFRIFQEALNNIIKHSKASAIDVLVAFYSNKFLLKIDDNGDGFNVSDLNQKENEQKGLGIRNMKNRSHIMGANYSINSQPGKGTTVTIDLPIVQPEKVDS